MDEITWMLHTVIIEFKAMIIFLTESIVIIKSLPSSHSNVNYVYARATRIIRPVSQNEGHKFKSWSTGKTQDTLNPHCRSPPSALMSCEPHDEFQPLNLILLIIIFY